jgi:hypothetical protein
MPTATPDHFDTDIDVAAPRTEPFFISVPDAERLALQSRFVRNQLEAEILSEIGARIRRATLLEPSNVPGDLVTKGTTLTLFVAGDDQDAKEQALTLGRDIGFDAVEAGPLKNARWLESLGYLNIQLGYTQKMGTQIGFKLVH